MQKPAMKKYMNDDFSRETPKVQHQRPDKRAWNTFAEATRSVSQVFVDSMAKQIDWSHPIVLHHQVLRHRSRRASKQGLNIESFGRLHQKVEERPAEKEAVGGQDQTAGCAKQKAPFENSGITYIYRAEILGNYKYPPKRVVDWNAKSHKLEHHFSWFSRH